MIIVKVYDGRLRFSLRVWKTLYTIIIFLCNVRAVASGGQDYIRNKRDFIDEPGFPFRFPDTGRW